MADTPGQSFVKQLFGGLQRGVEGLPRAVRQSRLDERQRNLDSFTQLLNVQRVTREFRDQQLRQAQFQESLLKSDAIKKASILLGDAARTGQIQEAIGPISKAFGEAGVNPATTFGVLQKLQPGEEPDVTSAIKRVQAGGREGDDLALIARQPGGGTLLGRLVPVAGKTKSGADLGLNTNQARVLTGQINNAIRGEKRLTDSRVSTLRKAIQGLKDNALPGDPQDPAIPEMEQRLKNLKDYLKFLETGAAGDSVLNEFLQTIETIEERTN